jgi:hypothetical protein
MRNTNRLVRCSVASAALLLFCGAGQAMEPAKQEAAQPEQPAPAPAQPRTDIKPSDESAFYEKVQRVTHYRNLRELKVPDATLAELARGNADVAVAALSQTARQGSQEANVALVRIQHWCSAVGAQRVGDPKAQIAKLPAELPAERASRIAGVINAEAAFLAKARPACARAGGLFDYKAIEAQLRASAAAGDPASATELAQFVRDPAQRQALLQAAVDKKYPPAMYKIATNLLIAVQRGQTTENVSAIRELLKQAGRTIPRAKLDLANCMAVGCDGHPADALTARAFGIDAARDGEPTAFLSMTRMPWGRLTRVQMLAWQYFGDRLNEGGCMGDAYIPTSIAFAVTIPTLERAQDPKVIDAAKEQMEILWRDHGVRATKENGCG